MPRTPQEEQKEKDGKPRVTVINEGGESHKEISGLLTVKLG